MRLFRTLSIRTMRTTVCVAVLSALWAASASAEEQIALNIVEGTSIPEPLSGEPGDPSRGREVSINRKLGNCLACHKMPIPEQPFHGEVGPDLSEVGSTYSEGELRLRVVDPKVLNSDTIMPAFYRSDELNRVMKQFQGKTVLTAQEVEDVVAYLLTLKEK